MDSNVEQFTFTWNIENLVWSSAEQKISTSFQVLMLDGTKWEFHLVINRFDEVIVRLRRAVHDDGPETIQVDFDIYFFVKCEKFDFEEHKKGVTFSNGKCFQCQLRTLFKDDFINDTISLKCVLWKSCVNRNDGISDVPSLSPPCVLTDESIDKMYKDSLKQLEGEMDLYNVYPNRCSAVTRFQIEKRSMIYHLEQFSSLKKDCISCIPFTSVTDLPSLLMTLHLKKDSDEVEVCVRIVEQDIEDWLFVKCEIWAMSKTQNKLPILKGTNVFEPDTNNTVWKTTSFRKSSMLENGSLYLQEDTLSLQIELTVCDGETSTEVKEIGFAEPPQTDNDPKTLSDELFQFFVNQTLCDISLQAKDGAIQAHKIVVCAKSPVFRAMFESEMAEKRTQVVKIPDVDIQTLKRMLTHMYSEKFESILNEYDAMQLYSVADKYQYDKLKKKCSDFLKCNLLNANVCDVLEMADTYDDNKLKLAAQVYMKSKCNEILISDEWKNLINNNIRLASDTLVYISTNIS